MEALGALLADIPPGTTLVITVKAPSFADSAKGKKLIKLAEAHGAALELSVRGQEDMIRFLQAGSKRLGCELDRANAKYLLEICPADMLLLENELRKICGYAGGGEISRRHIDGVATPKTEARVFDLQRLILNGRPEKALELLGRLFFLREDPIAILATLSMGFCDLYRARAARDAGDSLAAMMKNYGYKSEYRAKKAYEGAGKLSAGQLRLAVGMLCDCDRDMKSTGVNNKVYLEQLVVGLISLCGEGR